MCIRDRGNKADLDKVNDTVKNAIEFIPVSNLDEVLSISLVNKGKKRVDKKIVQW